MGVMSRFNEASSFAGFGLLMQGGYLIFNGAIALGIATIAAGVAAILKPEAAAKVAGRPSLFQVKP